MRIEAIPVEAGEIAETRDAHRREMACQIVHDSWAARGLADAYALRADGRTIGHGIVGGAPGEPRESVVEVWMEEESRGAAVEALGRLVEASGAREILAQTNDALLSRLLSERAVEIETRALLFADGGATALRVRGAAFRRREPRDEGRNFAHAAEPVGAWLIESEGEIVATGGALTHYNPPFADLHMEVAPGRRGRGYGSLMVQELRRVCREAGLTPAARCNASNAASRACLLRGGMLECGRLERGRIRL